MAGILMVAGEASGDLHGAGVIRALKEQLPGVEVFGIGGPRMRAAGMETLFDISQTAVIGFTEVVKHLRFFRRMFHQMKALARQRHPDLAILIDYPGFNLRFAGFLHGNGVPVLYYISPQVWAWGQRRVRKIARVVDHMAVIFEFERDFYRRFGVPATFVGHPLLESLKVPLTKEEFLQRYELDAGRPVLGLLPGSRVQEVKRLLPDMLRTAEAVRREVPECQIAVSRAANVPDEVFRDAGVGQDAVLVSETYALMAHSSALVVASGTATVEAAIIGTPFAVVYRVSPLSYWLGKRLIRVDHIAMANIVAGERIVPEFVQREFRPPEVAQTVLSWIRDPAAAEAMRERLKNVRQKLGKPGASQRVAELALNLMRRGDGD